MTTQTDQNISTYSPAKSRRHPYRKSGLERYSSTNNLNIDASNAVTGNLDNEKIKKMTEEPEENDEKMSKKLQNQLKEAKEEYEKKVEELHKKNNVFIGITIIVGVVAVLTALSLGFKGHEENRHELRLMLVGKTGAGKSASGNTILRENSFSVEASPASVTGNCEKRNKFIAGRNITIIDTPGVMDTWPNSEQILNNAPQCISSFRPAPHVFLLVIRLGRFTQEEINAVKWIQENFGEEALRFTLILFTGGDLLERKPVEKFISNSHELQNLVDTCQGRYHVFNNYDQSNRTQVTQLFEKINQMLHENMGYIYSKELYLYVKQEEERKRKILEREIIECNSLREQNRLKEEIKRKELEKELKEEKIKVNEISNRQQEEIMILEKDKNLCKSLVSEITEKEAIKRKKLEKELKEEKIKVNEISNRQEEEIMILEKEKNLCKSLVSEIREKEAIKRKELEEEYKKEEKRKMNEMAKKLRDEQFENTKLKAQLNEPWLMRYLNKIFSALKK